MDDTASASPAEARASAGIWRNRNLLILVGGQWVSQAGTQLFTMAVYWTVLSQTHSRSDLGFVGSLLSLAAIFGLVAGALVDRWDRRRTLIWVDSVRAVLAASLVAAALADRLPVFALVAVVLAMSIVGQFFYPAESALLPAVVAADDLVAANSLNQGASASAQLLGAALGGVILGLLGPTILFGFNALSFAVSVASLMLIRLAVAPPPRVRAAGAGLGAAAASLWREIMEGQRLIWRDPFLRRALPVSVMVNFALAPITFLDVAWVRQVLHLGAVVYGLFGVAIVVGILIGSALASLVAPRVALPRLVMVLVAAAGLCVFGLSRLPVVAPDLAFLAAFGLFVGVLNTAVAAAMQRSVPDAVRGRVFGALSAFSNLAIPFGGLLAGIGAALVPLGALFAGAGLVLAATALLTIGMPGVARLEVTAGA